MIAAALILIVGIYFAPAILRIAAASIGLIAYWILCVLTLSFLWRGKA